MFSIGRVFLPSCLQSCKRFPKEIVSAANVYRPFSGVGEATGIAPPVAEADMPYYALGLNIAKKVNYELKGLFTPEQLEPVLKGFAQSMKNQVDNPDALWEKYSPQLHEILTAAAKERKEEAIAKGEEFIQEYMGKYPHAKRLESGLVMCQHVHGSGEAPTANSSVLMRYCCSLPDGTICDSTIDHVEPVKLDLKNLIGGLQEGIPRMMPGGTSFFVVPPHLAYGDNGSPPVIPPTATLVFEVQLVSVC